MDLVNTTQYHLSEYLRINGFFVPLVSCHSFCQTLHCTTYIILLHWSIGHFQIFYHIVAVVSRMVISNGAIKRLQPHWYTYYEPLWAFIISAIDFRPESNPMEPYIFRILRRVQNDYALDWEFHDSWLLWADVTIHNCSQPETGRHCYTHWSVDHCKVSEGRILFLFEKLLVFPFFPNHSKYWNQFFFLFFTYIYLIRTRRHFIRVHCL